ncbi:MAG: restriction endonuclease subunit S, partial [Erysipelotrichales bacterium]
PVTFCIAQDMVALRAKRDLIYPKFLFAALRSQEVQNQIKNLNVDGVIPHFKKADFNKLKLPNPCYKNQKIIGDFYFNFCEKINLNNQINQTLESKQEGKDPELTAMCAISGKSEVELQQMTEDDLAELRATASLFPDELMESELGEVPKGWEILDIDKTTSLIIDHRGKTPKKLGSDWSDTGITVLSAKHIKDGYIVNREQLRFVDRELYNKWMKEELEEGDILLTSEGPMGEMYYLASDEKYCLSQRLYALRANTDLISSAFLYFWLLSPYAKSDMNGRATGTTVVGIRQSELRKVKVLTPPKNICDLFNEKVKANLKQIALNNNKSVDLAHIRDILLPKLMAGDLTLSVGC